MLHTSFTTADKFYSVNFGWIVVIVSSPAENLEFLQEMKNEAASQLASLYNEIRPAIEEHERDSQDSVATSVAEKWIEACCSKLKAEFNLYSSIINNVACTPRSTPDQAKPCAADNGNDVKYLGF